MNLFLRLCLFVLFCLSTNHAFGQDAPLTTVAEVLRLQPMDAMAGKPKLVRLAGVVLGLNAAKTTVYFHDGTAGIGVQLTPQIERPKLGDGVVIEGRAVLYRVAGFSHTRVQATSCTIDGKPSVPTAVQIDIATLNEFSHFDQWVSLEGYIMDWKHRSPTLTVRVVGPNGMTTVLVQVENASEIPPKLIGAKVRLTGVNTGDHSSLNAMAVTDLRYLDILEPGYGGVFEAPLVSLPDVTSRKVELAKRFRIQGVVAGTSGRSFVYLQGTGGAMICQLLNRSVDPRAGVTYAEPVPQPSLSEGDEVDVVGSVSEESDLFTSGIRLTNCIARVTGKGAIPKPVPIDIHRLRSVQETDRWVSLEAVVNAWTKNDDSMHFSISDATGSLEFAVREWSSDPPPKDLFGARVRFTGIGLSLGQNEQGPLLDVPNGSFMEIINRGVADPFEAPLTTTAAIKERTVPTVERIRVKGVVVGIVDDALYVRDGMAAIHVQLESPLQSNHKLEGASLNGTIIGDEVEIVGSPLRPAKDADVEPFDLVNALVRVTGHQETVDPVEATLPDLATGAHDSDVVLTRGRLLSEQQLPQADGEWRSTMIIESRGIRLPVVYGGHTHGAFDTLKIDDEITVKALVNRATSRQPQSLWVMAPSDVKSLGMSPVVRARQLWLWGTIIAVAFALLVGWVLQLLRSQRIQKAAAHELKEAAKSIRESEQRWKLLFEQSPLSVQVFGPDGQTIRFNNAWSNLFRLSDEAGYAFNPLKDPDLNASGAVNLIRQAFEGHSVTVPPVPFPVNTDPPEIRWIGAVLYPVKNEAGELLEVVAVHNDITERKRADDAMQSLNQTLELRVQERTAELEEARAEIAKSLDQERELGELKNRFVSMVSHEFRTPLGVTMSAVEIMRHYDERLPSEKRRELCNEIHEATRGMADLMEQVLILGRAEAGRLAFRPKLIDFHTLSAKIIEEALSATHRKCPIHYRSMGDFNGACGDESLLRHIIGNLISNAVKYSPENSAVDVTARRDGTDVICEVTDRGIGIPEADQSKLFEAFHRCTNVGDIPGTGLGLVIVKHCVDLHGGKIELRSEVGKGTTFGIRLPLFAATPPHIPKLHEEDPHH